VVIKMRPIWEIAAEIRRTWKTPNKRCSEVLDALEHLDGIDSQYQMVQAKDLILKFITSSKSFRTPRSFAIKRELMAYVYENLTK